VLERVGARVADGTLVGVAAPSVVDTRVVAEEVGRVAVGADVMSTPRTRGPLPDGFGRNTKTATTAAATRTRPAPETNRFASGLSSLMPVPPLALDHAVGFWVLLRHLPMAGARYSRGGFVVKGGGNHSDG